MRDELLKKELQEILHVGGVRKKGIDKAVIFDGKQYSVRIPKKFADAVNLDPKKDMIRFNLETSTTSDSKPKLTAEVIQK